MEYLINNEVYDLKQPKMNMLPLLSLNIDKIIEYFKFDKIIDIYKHVLLESRILFFSKNIVNLNIFTETFSSLIYPMKYINQIVPIVPLELFSLIESEEPSMLGINLAYSKDFFETYNLDMQDYTYVVVDIDNGTVEQYSEITSNQKLIFSLTEKVPKEEIPEMPKHYKSKFTDVLRSYLKELKEIRDMKNSESKENVNNKFRHIFLNFLVSILQEYGSFIDYSVSQPNNINTNQNTNNLSQPTNPFKEIGSMFRADEFINNQNLLDKPFYKKLFNTKLFCEFIYRNLFPKNAKDKLEILFFDERIKEKNGRKIFAKKSETPFLKTNLYEYKKKYEVEVKKNIEKCDISQILENKNFEKAIKYGQEILIEKNDIFFQYSIFPKMLFSIFFSPSKKNYQIPPTILNEDIDNVNNDVLRQCKLSKK